MEAKCLLKIFLEFTKKKKKKQNVYSLRILKKLSIQYWVHIHTYIHTFSIKTKWVHMSDYFRQLDLQRGKIPNLSQADMSHYQVHKIQPIIEHHVLLLGFAITIQKPMKIHQVSCKNQSCISVRVSNDTSNLARISDDTSSLARVSNDTSNPARVSDDISGPIRL